MRLRRPRSRALAVLIGLLALPWTIQLEQARVSVAVQAVIADLRRSLHVHSAHQPPPQAPRERTPAHGER